jgi:uncharacterized protein (DUF2252 family)
MKLARRLEKSVARIARNDAARLDDHPLLHARRVQKLAASPLGFLRGTAPFFFALLRGRADVPGLDVPAAKGKGWIVGDAHLENFGLFRTESGKDVRFDLNDFDEVTVAPHRWDVLRLLTATLLADALPPSRAVPLARAVLAGYMAARDDADDGASPPDCVAQLLARARARNVEDLLQGRVEEGHFLLSTRYLALSKRERQAAFDAFSRYAEVAHPDAFWEPIDAAVRVAGNGSLGTYRVALLARRSGKHERLFEMKGCSLHSAAMPAPQRVRPEPPEAVRKRRAPGKLVAGDRVASGTRALLGTSPFGFGTATLSQGTSCIVRRLTPQDDKLDIAGLSARDVFDLAPYLGTLLGRAHRRAGAETGPAWSESVQHALVASSIELAAAHRAAHGHYVHRKR